MTHHLLRSAQRIVNNESRASATGCKRQIETIMTKSRMHEDHAKLHQEEAYHRLRSTKGSAGTVAAGRTAYRDDYQRDYGPDLDESLDKVESGHEF